MRVPTYRSNGPKALIATWAASARQPLTWGALLMVVSAPSAFGGAEGCGGPRPTATLVRTAGMAQLAVDWKGEVPLVFSAWVDLDGNGEALGGAEQVVASRAVGRGVHLFSVESQTGAPSATALIRLKWTPLTKEASRSTERTENCSWASGFTLGDLENSVEASAVYDDGGGPALFVGGSFKTAEGSVVNHIAKWDGAAWHPLSGPAGVGTNNLVYALSVWNDGTGAALYVGGRFEMAGGQPVNYIARWNGSVWSALSSDGVSGVDGFVDALTTWDDAPARRYTSAAASPWPVRSPRPALPSGTGVRGQPSPALQAKA